MTEWGVVAVIVVLVGLFTGIVTPIIKLNSSIVKLTDEVANIMAGLGEFKKRYVDHLNELKHNDEKMQEEINNHETRISVLEFKKNQKN